MRTQKQRIFSLLVLLTMVIVLTCIFVACDKGGAQDKNYTVTIHPDNGQADFVWDTKTDIPVITKYGYHIVGYYLDADMTISTTLESLKATNLTADLNVYVKWEKDSVPPKTKIVTNNLLCDYDTRALSGKVSNSTTVFSFNDEISVEKGTTYTISTDINGINVIPSKTVNLEIGDNIFYVLVSNEDELTLYTATVRRKPIYTVTFDTLGGTEVEAQQVEEDAFATAPTTEKNGCTFEKWNWDFSMPITENTIITAIWNAFVYNIIYDFNIPEDSVSQEVDNSMNPTTYTVDDTIHFSAPRRNGYHFTGWSVSNISKGTTGTVTTTAQWRPIIYEIVYDFGDSNSVSKAANNDFNPRYYSVESEINFVEPTRAGYSFVSWDKNIEKGTTGTQTVTASWNVIDYDIVYNFGDASSISKAINNELNPATYTIEDEIVFSKPTRAGYEFLGWDKTIVKGMTNEQTISASWSIIDYDISYNLGDADSVSKATNNDSNPTTYTVEDKLVFEAPSRAGYSFVSWNKDLEKGTTGTQIITASWDIIDYDIVYDFGDTSSASKAINNKLNQATYTVEDEIVFSAPTRAGYEFVSWDKNIEKGTTGVQTITASWSIITYEIDYDLNDANSVSKATNSGLNPATYTVEDEIAFENPTRPYYEFVEWSKNISKGSVGNQNIVAVWKAETHTITYVLNNWTNAADNKDIYTIEDQTFALLDGVSGEKLFCGWYLDDEYTNCIETIDASSMKDYTVYAMPDCGATKGLSIENGIVKGYLGISTNIVIPSYYKGDTVVSIGNSAFNNCTNLTSVTISNKITSIGNSAFSGCNGLTKIIGYPKAVSVVAKQCNSKAFAVVLTNGKSIDDFAFSGCSGLTSVTIPDNVASIGSYAFSGCDNLQNVYISDIAAWCNISGVNNLMEYGTSNKNLYLNNELVTSLTIPNEVTTIPSYAFNNCIGLSEVTITNSVTSIGNYAFSGCNDVTKITGVSKIASVIAKQCGGNTFEIIITSGESIDESAFSGCSGLTSVTIPDCVANIGNYAFSGCDNLQNIYIADIAAWCNISGLDNLMRYGTSSKNLYLNNKLVTSLTIPDGVTAIPSYAFLDCAWLTELNIGICVTSIGDSAFRDCVGLTSIAIPDSVTSIGGDAFHGCTGLTNAKIDNSTTSIGYNAFAGCSGLTKIAGSSKVASSIAKQCSSMAFEVDITSGTSIENSAFSGCVGLTNVTIGNSVTSIGGYSFSDCTMLTSVTIGNNITSISSSAFSNCSGLITVNWNATSCTSVGSAVYTIFSGCLNLTTVNIGESVTIIPSYAFMGCKGLTSITISDSVTDIYESAFGGCTGLTSVTIPNSVTNIGWRAFAGCTGLTSITIPDSVTSIGNYAFSGCSGLTSITIGNSVTSIGNSAFQDCYRLVEVYNKSTLPITAGSSSNGYVAYYAKNVYKEEGGSKLSTDNCYVVYTDGTEKIVVAYTGTETELTLPTYITQINDWAFYNCIELTSVTITNSVTSIGSRAFSYCSGLTSITIPDRVTSIGDQAFWGCSGLTRITIPNSVTSICGSAFSNCSGLTSIIVGKNNPKYHSAGNCLIETSTKILILGCKTSVIPSDGSVISIGESAFYWCSGLTSITIPAGVTSIGNTAFGLTKLTSVTIPDSVTSIGSFAFSNCLSLTNINFEGTKAQWESITKGDNWNNGIATDCTITCSDGTI